MADPLGFYQEGRPERPAQQDGRLGADPRQDAQQGVRGLALPVADAAGDQHGRRLGGAADARGHGAEHQRPGDHAGQQAQEQPRSEGLEGFQVRGAVRIFDAQLPAALLPGRSGRAESRYRRADPRRAAARDGGQPARRQYRRLPRARSVQPARGLRRGRLHPHPVEGNLGRPPMLRLRRQRGLHPAEPEHLRRVVPRGAQCRRRWRAIRRTAN